MVDRAAMIEILGFGIRDESKMDRAAREMVNYRAVKERERRVAEVKALRAESAARRAAKHGDNRGDDVAF